MSDIGAFVNSPAFSVIGGWLTALEQGEMNDKQLRDNLAMYFNVGQSMGLIGPDVKFNEEGSVNEIISDMARGFEQQFPGGRIPWATGEYAAGTKAGTAELEAGQKLGLGEYKGYASRILRLGEERKTDLLGEYGRGAADIRSEFARETTGLLGRAERRYETGMGMMEGMGEQEKKDIREEYGGEQGRMQAELTGRGLSGTTIAPSMRAGLLREQTGAIGRLEERIRQQKLGMHQALSGDVVSLAAQRSQLGTAIGMDLFGGGMNLRTGLSGEQLSAESQFGAGDVNLRAQQRGQLLNWRTGRRAGDLGLSLDLSGEALNFMQSPNVTASPMESYYGLMGGGWGTSSVEAWTPEESYDWFGNIFGPSVMTGGMITGGYLAGR